MTCINSFALFKLDGQSNACYASNFHLTKEHHCLQHNHLDQDRAVVNVTACNNTLHANDIKKSIAPPML